MPPEGSQHLPTRRDALAAGLALAAGALARPARAEAPATGDYGPFKMGLQSYSLRHFSRDDALAKTRELGLHYWESFRSHIPDSTDRDRVAEARRAARDAGVSVVGYGVIRFTRDHDANRKPFEFARLMGIDYLSADPDPDSFDSLDRLVKEFGVAVGIHNHGPGHHYATIDAIARAIEGHDEKIGCCVDTGHFLRSKEDPVRAVEAFGKRVYGVHLKDVRGATEFTVLGKGDLKTADLLRALKKNDYSYCLALEYEENESAPMDDIRACLAAVREAVGRL